MICPIKTDPNWIALEKSQPDLAYYLWNKYEGEVPAEYYNLYQLQPKTDVDKNIEELDGYLVNFISKFGFKAEELDTLKNRIGVDAIGVTDVINKLILFAKDRNITTLPEEVAHAAVMLMGPSHPAIFELMGNIQDWDKYESIKKQYLPIYKNELQVEIEAVGQLISEAIVSNYKDVGIKPNILKRAIEQIREFINNLFSNPKTQSEFDKIKKVADKVALNILKGNYNYISNAVPSGVKLDYDLAVSQNPLAQQIIQTFNSIGNALTGSLALAAQGETVYRDPNELIHDLDFIVHNNLEYRKTKHLVDKMGGVPIHFGWQNVGDSKITHTFMIPASGFKITNVTREWAGRNYIKDFDLVDSKGNIVEVTPTNAMVVDFFVNENLPNPGLKFTRFQDIYAGKLSLSTFGANERFFRRAKDQKDYILSTPTVFYPPSEAFTYYQLPSTQVKEGVSELFESNPELANIGTTQQYSQYLDSIFPDSKVKDIVYHGVVKGREAYNNILEKGFDPYYKKNWDSKKNENRVRNSGIFFSDFNTGQMYGGHVGYRLNEKGEYENFDDSTIISAVLNIEFLDSSQETSSGTAEKFYNTNKDKSNIGMFGLEGGSEGVHDNYVVFEPEQIHILGNKQDIEGFKKFVQSEESPLDIDIENCNIPS